MIPFYRLCRRLTLICAGAAALAACSLLAPLAKPDLSAEASALRDGAYRLDGDHAALIFRIDHLGFSKYLGRFENFDASLDFDPDNPAAAGLEAVIDMASLDVANPEFAATLLGPAWFDAEAHPQAIFRSTAIEVTGETSGLLRGELTLKGQTAPVVLEVVFNGGARDRLRANQYVVGFSARGTLDRTAFGVSRFSGLIADNVDIEIQAEFIRDADSSE